MIPPRLEDDVGTCRCQSVSVRSRADNRAGIGLLCKMRSTALGVGDLGSRCSTNHCVAVLEARRRNASFELLRRFGDQEDARGADVGREFAKRLPEGTLRRNAGQQPRRHVDMTGVEHSAEELVSLFPSSFPPEVAVLKAGADDNRDGLAARLDCLHPFNEHLLESGDRWSRTGRDAEIRISRPPHSPDLPAAPAFSKCGHLVAM